VTPCGIYFQKISKGELNNDVHVK
jgi:hypothetical protein